MEWRYVFVVHGVCGLGMLKVCLLLWSYRMCYALAALFCVSGFIMGVVIAGHS